ncbi:MAG: hypothetical protein ACM3UU_10340 [Ignavibacteriales bacterium]
MSIWWWLSALFFAPTNLFEKLSSLICGTLIGIAWLLFIKTTGFLPDYTLLSWAKYVFFPAGVLHAFMGTFVVAIAADSKNEELIDNSIPYRIDLMGGLAVVILGLAILPYV